MKELTYNFLKLKHNNVFIFIKKGTLIYDLECVLLYEMNMYFWNNNDPVQETNYCIGDVAKYDTYYHIFSHLINKKKYILIRKYYTNMDVIKGKIIIDGNNILRYFKIKELDLV
jgi:hypothetical protein